MPEPGGYGGAGARADHCFGGGWTEIKLRAVTDYLRFYTTALKEKPTRTTPFELWYIDAFAGTGDRTVTKIRGGLFDGTPLIRDQIRLKGSARRALAIDPPFHHLVFIEKDPRRFAS